MLYTSSQLRYTYLLWLQRRSCSTQQEFSQIVVSGPRMQKMRSKLDSHHSFSSICKHKQRRPEDDSFASKALATHNPTASNDGPTKQCCKMAQLHFSFDRLLKNRFFKFGLPFFILMVGGSFGLKEFTNLRYQYSKKVTLTPEEAAKHGVEMKKPGEVTLESEYEKLKKIDIDNWENKRGPRPWEEGTQQRKASG